MSPRRRTPDTAGFVDTEQAMDGRSGRQPGMAPFGPAAAAMLVLGVLACSRLPALPPVLLLVPLAVLGALAWWRFGDWCRPAGALAVGFALLRLRGAWTRSKPL